MTMSSENTNWKKYDRERPLEKPAPSVFFELLKNESKVHIHKWIIYTTAFSALSTNTLIY